MSGRREKGAGKLRAAAAPLALLTMAAILAIGGAASACESANAYSDLQQAQKLRAAGKLDDAYRTAQRILVRAPDGAYPRFVLGQLELDQARKGHGSRSRALNTLQLAANAVPPYSTLDRAEKNCRENRELYTVFDTLAVELDKNGHPWRAEGYFVRGEHSMAALSREDQGKLLYNMGVYYKSRLNLAKASSYLKRSAALGDTGAASLLDTVQKVQQVAKSP